MPIYEYQCEQCGKVEEALQKINEEPLKRCTHCSGKLHKLISHSAFHLKGTGWYVTDYAGKSQNSKESGNNNANETKTADSKASDTTKSTSSD